MTDPAQTNRFSYSWMVRSTDYLISYRVARHILPDEAAICRIIHLKGGTMGKTALGSLLGFNLVDDPAAGRFGDAAEISVYEAYLKRLVSYQLLTIEGRVVRITAEGSQAIRTGLRYDYSSADVSHYDSSAIADTLTGFSYQKEFGLPSKLTPAQIFEYSVPIEDALLLTRLQFQVFEQDPFKGEVIRVYKKNSLARYHAVGLKCELSDDATGISFFVDDVERPDLQRIMSGPENVQRYIWLLREGRFDRLLRSRATIGAAEIREFSGLWKWKELAMNPAVDWQQMEVLELFHANADGHAWRALSSHYPLELLKDQLNPYLEFWHWDVLTERLPDEFIRDHIRFYPWDFEVVSGKPTGLIMLLLENEELAGKRWDWAALSRNLPDDYIVKHIEKFPWDFYQLTTVKFDVFKTVFAQDAEKQVKNPWNWLEISGQIKLGYLFKNLAVLAPRIDWPLVLERFFNDLQWSAVCMTDPSFAELMMNGLPANFVITRQHYHWEKASIGFFDQRGLINWTTTAYLPGFDANPYIDWDSGIFNAYAGKITSTDGFAAVSRSVKSGQLIRDNLNFPWNWIELSRNKHIAGDSAFIAEAIRSADARSYQFEWHVLLPEHPLGFWNSLLDEIAAQTDTADTTPFWAQLTALEKPEFIYARLHLPWDWTVMTAKFDNATIISTFPVQKIAGKWNWQALTKKLSKEEILANLEICREFWDWDQVILEVIKPADLTLANGELSRFAACLHTLEAERKNKAWKALTSIFSIQQLFDYTVATASNPFFKWDWDHISVQKHLPTDFRTLDSLKNKLNWTLFSDSPAVKGKFGYSRWGKDKKAGTDFIRSFLNKYAHYWDWKVLSRNNDLNWNRPLLSEYKNVSWDWDHLSLYGKFLNKNNSDPEDYLIALLKKYPVNFGLLSERKDLDLSAKLIRHYRNRPWDWERLSANQSATLAPELLIELADKNWNWHGLTARRDLVIDNDLLLQLPDKPWDWNTLSDSEVVIFHIDFLDRLLDKPWDWLKVSRHPTFKPTKDILILLSGKELDWELISCDPEVNPTRDMIERFKSKWNWKALTKNPKLDCADIALVAKYKECWDWHYLCTRTNLTLDQNTLQQFREHLDWNALSMNTAIDFNESLIAEFQSRWNWKLLKDNQHIKDLIGDHVKEVIGRSPNLKFLDSVTSDASPWAGFVYHFSHIENAVQIIKQQRIQSRNKATILGDAAGSVVHRRDDAHSFARFYFRPKTPTQFYNEFLGVASGEGYHDKYGYFVSWYDKARFLGHPKCPVPIFFKVALQEILFKYPEHCYISSGNMQTTATDFGKIGDMLGKFNTTDLFFTPAKYSTAEDYHRYRSYAQQEFLFRDELSFTNIESLEILCASEEDRRLLISLIGAAADAFTAKIKVDPSLYNRLNPRVDVHQNTDSISIYPNLPGPGFLSLFPFDPGDEILYGQADQIKGRTLNFSQRLVVKNMSHPFKISYTDESGRNWFIYEKQDMQTDYPEAYIADHKDDRLTSKFINPSEVIAYLKSVGFEADFSANVRHYTLEQHTLLVCGVFEKYFSGLFSEQEANFLRVLLVLHDIGKPRAFQMGNKDRQYEFTARILAEIRDQLPFSHEEMQLLSSLLSSDVLGEFFQSRQSPELTVQQLSVLAADTKLGLPEFLRYMMVYYQCDTAAYTADEGGLRFLEKLYHYENGSKVMNGREDLLQFSPKYWDLYLELKKEVERCL